jgi:biopolymer transport protein ExbD
MAKSKKKRRVADASTDLTPMIDVVFQLIIFFIVTANLDQQQVKKDIELPPVLYGVEEKRKDPRQVTIQVTKTGRFYIGSRQSSEADLQHQLNLAVTYGGTDIPVLIRGDVNTTHRSVRTAMDICARAGIYKIRFAGTVPRQRVTARAEP